MSTLGNAGQFSQFLKNVNKFIIERTKYPPLESSCLILRDYIKISLCYICQLNYRDGLNIFLKYNLINSFLFSRKNAHFCKKKNYFFSPVRDYSDWFIEQYGGEESQLLNQMFLFQISADHELFISFLKNAQYFYFIEYQPNYHKISNIDIL